MTATQGGSPLFRQALTFDPSGQIVALRWRNGTAAEMTQRYGYDSVGRLTSWYDGADTTTYQYDMVGNPIGTWKTGSLYTETHAYLNGRPNQVVYKGRLAITTKRSAGLLGRDDAYSTKEEINHDAIYIDIGERRYHGNRM